MHRRCHPLVVATGKVTVKGASQLEGGNGVALLAGGNVSLTGAPEGSYLQGLVYTNGSLSADHVSVVGPTLAEGSEASVFSAGGLYLPVGQSGVWKGGGGPASVAPDPATSVTVYLDANSVPMAAGPGWASARVVMTTCASR
jgi:hypothetical protein